MVGIVWDEAPEEKAMNANNAKLEELLIKYMTYLFAERGTNFIYPEVPAQEPFNDEEWGLLCKLGSIARDRLNFHD